MDKTKEYYDTLLDESFNRAILDEFQASKFEMPAFVWNEDIQLYVSKQTYKIDGTDSKIVTHLKYVTLDSGKEIIDATLMFGTFLDNGHFDADGYFANVFYADGEWTSFKDAGDEVMKYIKSQPLDHMNDLLMQFQEFNIGGVT